MHTVYLVGQITSNLETYTWIDKVENYFAKDNAVSIINPCDNKFNAGVLDKANGKNSEFSKIALKNHSNVLAPKDRYYVKKVNWIFMNMNIYSDERPLFGSFFELAWTFD